MKNFTLSILLIYITFQAQIIFCQTSNFQFTPNKTNLNNFKNQTGSSMFNFYESDPVIFTGENPQDEFGYTVSSAGDVNGDGYLDIIVGASHYYFSYTKKTYIYFGSAIWNSSPDISWIGGGGVSSAGDVNGDGYSDVISGANLFFGGAIMDTIADAIFTDNANSAGDVNGDGFSDIIIRDNIYFGGALMDTIADVVFSNSEGSVTIGDVNGDGYSDVIVGHSIYFGEALMDTIADVILTGSWWTVSSAGDVNGDGYSDVITGGNGIVHIYFGGSSMDNIADVTLTNEFMGNSISSAGDVNGDGYSDVIIGAQEYETYNGRVYLYYGGTLMDNVADITWSGHLGDFGFFGCAVSSFSDGSGVLIGEWGGPNLVTGNVYLYRFYSLDPVLINPANNSALNPLTINFTWSELNTALYYILEISTNSLFSNIIETDTVYVDTSKVISGFQKNTKYFWRVRSKNSSGLIHNSLISNFTTFPPISTNIKLLFEGMYSTIYNQLPRMDSITVYLRETSPPFAISDSAKNKIDSNSFSNVFRFNNAIAGTYYVVVKHFNCLETWSKAGGENIIYDTTSYVYDFTTSISQAYGSNLKLKGSKYCLYSGDINNDGYINLTDLIPIKNDASNFTSGNFLITDLTGDNIVDLTDVSLCYNNASNFVAVIKP